MLIENFGCLLTDNTRSRAYLQKLVANAFIPARVIYVELHPKKKTEIKLRPDAHPVETAVEQAFAGRRYFLYSKSQSAIVPMDNMQGRMYASFDPDKKVLDTLAENSISYKAVESDSLNGTEVVKAVADAGIGYCLFSGGAILGKEILSQGVRFIHIHPGWLPDVKGSMAIEWSILLHGKCAATAFFMEEKIDRGNIILRKHFEAPELQHNSVPPLYSSHIRSEVLVDIMKNYAENGTFASFSQTSGAGGFYYKMHPALHNVVFHECIKRDQ